jgi:hypothetical protein
MATQPIRNIDLFKKYNIPYRDFSKDQIVVETAKISFLVDLFENGFFNFSKLIDSKFTFSFIFKLFFNGN